MRGFWLALLLLALDDILSELGGLGASAREVNRWRFWYRLPGGIRLRQHGYCVDFTGLDAWDLQIPCYLPPPIGN